jgi:membrane peptidoglycan carboxypeptidase
VTTTNGDGANGTTRRKPRGRRRTTGAVDRLPSGRWRGRFTTPDNRRLTASFATKTEADAWLAAQTTDVGRGVWVDPRRGRMTLGEYAHRWLAQRTDLRPRTRDDYEDIIRVHIVPSLGDKQMGKLSPGDIRGWYAELLPRCPGRARKAYRVVRVILNTAVADEIVVRNPRLMAWAPARAAA